jgi:dienelactone hydrolase
MLIQESHADVQTTANGKTTSMRIFVFHPTLPGYPNARFPGVVLFSEIYQVTGPVARFARQIAGQGYIVAAPSSYHDFTGPEPLAYDVPGTDQGNEWKVVKVWAPTNSQTSYLASSHMSCRPSSPTMKTPTKPSTTSSPSQHAPVASAQQACA